MPGLGFIEHKDPRSRDYGVRPLLLKKAPAVKVERVWNMLPQFPLDQGQEGACVGFGWCAELAAEPVRYNTTNPYAFAYYENAQQIDRREGRHYESGATLLAGAKLAKELGMVGQYRWAFGLEEVVSTLVSMGPVVLGVRWYESMYETDDNYGVQIHGDVVGGHCILANGYYPNHPLHGECIQWINSWGPEYGRDGVGFLKLADLDRLLDEQGEACIATDIVRR